MFICFISQVLGQINCRNISVWPIGQATDVKTQMWSARFVWYKTSSLHTHFGSYQANIDNFLFLFTILSLPWYINTCQGTFYQRIYFWAFLSWVQQSPFPPLKAEWLTSFLSNSPQLYLTPTESPEHCGKPNHHGAFCSGQPGEIKWTPALDVKLFV